MHRCHVQAAGLVHELAHQVLGRARAGGGVEHLFGVALDVLHQLAQGVDAQGSVDAHHQRAVAHQRDWGKVLERVKSWVAVHMRVDREQGAGRHEQAVAVGGRLGHVGRADVAVAAGLVVHHHRLAPELAELLLQLAGHHVGGAAGWVRHDDLYGLAGKVLGQHGHSGEGRSGQRRQEQGSSHAGQGHKVSLSEGVWVER